MAIIIAGRFQLQLQAEEAVSELIRAGFAPDKVTSFYVNPPGQHATYPIGGDRYQSPGTDEEFGISTDLQEVITEVVEAVIGSDVNETQDKDHISDVTNKKEYSTSTTINDAHALRLRKAGMRVAVEIANQTDEKKVATLLTQLGANDIEKAEGKIIDGDWVDFDPLSEPNYL